MLIAQNWSKHAVAVMVTPAFVYETALFLSVTNAALCESIQNAVVCIETHAVLYTNNNTLYFVKHGGFEYSISAAAPSDNGYQASFC